MVQNNFKFNYQFLVTTVVEVIEDSEGLYGSLVVNDVLWILIYILLISIRLYFIVTLLYDYQEIYRQQKEINFMEYHKDSFRECIVRHHIFIK